ncbi:CvpA family protein [bacterium]|jgi:membrane protein required for colicin V production|nr:CvpA family protein [bacterium]
MNFLDIILLVVLFFFVWRGFRAGIVGAIGGFVGIILGIWAGSNYMQLVSEWIIDVVNLGNEGLSNILAFIVIFIAVNVVIGIMVSIINKIFHIIPFINLANKLLGAIVGLIGGSLGIAALVYLLSVLPISNTISDMLIDSQVADWAMTVAVIIKPFIPAAINELKSIL